MPRLLTVCLVLSVCVSMAVASNWPRFRGENGTGISSDEGVPVELDGAKPLWQVDLPGPGNSSPVVWEGKIFLQMANEAGSQRKVVCISLKDGQTLWSVDIPGEPATTSNKNTLASGTPCTDGKRVYVPIWVGSSMSIVAFDFNGKEVWNQPLGSFAAGQHGAGHSPIAVGDKVVFLLDQDGKSTLVALNSATGKLAWEAPRKAKKSCYSTPILIDHPGVGQAILAGSTVGFTAHHPDTGAELWNWDWDNPLRTVGSPIAGEGMVFIGSGNGAGNRHMVAVRAGGSGDVTATAMAWEERRTLPYVPCMLAWGENLFFVNDGGLAGCVSLKTGDDVWGAPVRLGGTFSASPILVNGKIYAVNERGEIFVFEAADSFKLLHRTEVDDSIYATPAVADGRLLIRGRTKLFCFGKK